MEEEKENRCSDSNKDNKNNITQPNQFTPFMPLWQQYLPMAWSNMYNEYSKYTARMTELYKESAKSTERISKYWLDCFWKPLSNVKEEEEKGKEQGKKKR